MREVRGRRGIWFEVRGGYMVRGCGVRERGQRKGLLGRMVLGVCRRGGQRSEEEKEDSFVVVEDEGNGGGFGDRGRGRENQCWYDVEDMVEVEGKGTGDKKNQFGVVEEDLNYAGWGLRGV